MKKEIKIQKYTELGLSSVEDFVAVEEPLEISITYQAESKTIIKQISVTMRTPGNDAFLSIGFLFTEGIITDSNAVSSAKHINFDPNKISVQLTEETVPHLLQTDRNFYTTSSCGVCGKSSIEAIKTVSAYSDIKSAITIKTSTLFALPEKLKDQQITFKRTGGLHAAALFSHDGDFIALHEDVGRHNALDKIVGEALVNDSLPLVNSILLLSGRASFELIQKATMAGIKIVAAIGAPSSLAVDLAAEAGITLVGFLKNSGFNIYAHSERINAQ